ncbi:hypothetical protein C0Z18_31840 [Trinickia dabaoshanensis]|uniref:Uncharacterized protein n=1 Tax=Trinickia dabaoshanensis TaxID=564714 RepID=A0A2N7VB63_9BURK|nr:hypothetical protein C0Z18_31840 [Trinickia dabaoshanensis]
MDIIELARQAGLQVLLDARIGSQTYHSVCGSLPALQRFAEAIEAQARERSPQPRAAPRPRPRSPHHGARRLRKGAPRPETAPCTPRELTGRRPRPAPRSASAV